MTFNPKVSQVVLVDAPPGSNITRVAGEVHSSTNDTVCIKVNADDARAVKAGVCTASFPDEEGVIRVEGKLRVEHPFLFLDVCLVHPRLQRRSYVRAKTQCEVVATLPQANFGEVVQIKGISVDLSRGGARAQMSEALPEGETIFLSLLLNGITVMALAHVLESRNDGDTRFEFEHVADKGVEHIISRVLSATVGNPAARRLKRP